MIGAVAIVGGYAALVVALWPLGLLLAALHLLVLLLVAALRSRRPPTGSG